MAMRIIGAAVVLVLFTACHGYTPPRYDPALYPRTSKFYDLTWFWKTEKGAGAYAIEGFAKNTRYGYIRDLELTAALLDGEGKRLSETRFFFFPGPMAMDDMEPFTLSLPFKPGEKPAKIRFTYQYRLVEQEYGSPYFYSFETELY